MKKAYLILAVLLAALIWFQSSRPAVVDLAEFALKIFLKPIRAVYSLAAVQNRYEKKISALEKSAEFLRNEALKSQELLKENERLRGLLLFKSRISGRAIPAEVIAQDLSNIDSFIIIDKGKKDGIALDMAVAKGEGLVGKVFEVGAATAKVILLDNPNSKVGAMIQRTREQGVLVGLGGGLCKIVYLANDTDVKPGDIVTSGLNNIVGKGILIGEVIKVLRSPSSLYASAVVRPSCNLFKIEEVLCLE